ncbi:MAG: ATP-binding protein, partial [Caulobacteraceae bacterium]|nr:ATP-binding protein [Caulobacter sp.]
GLFEAERSHWFPALVVVDEAQLFAPAVGGDVAEEARKVSLGAMTNLMCRGRKRGLAGVIATQRLAKLAKNVAAEATNFLMGRTFLDIDMARAADLLGLERRQAEMFRDLGRGQFVALGPALSRRPLPVRVGAVETAPRGGTPTLTPLPEQPAEDARDMILAPAPVEMRAAVERRAPPPPQPSMNEILEEIVRSRPALAAEEEIDAVPSAEREAAHRTIAHDILQETGAHFRPETILYQDFCVRCRIKRIGGAPLPLADFKLLIAAARAGLDPERAGEADWQRAVAIARDIPEDLQAVFLIVAGAALTGAPCPGDARVASLCGQHAPGRARSRIKHLEKSNHFVVRNGLSGSRAIVLPDLGWETGWNDPAADGGDHGRIERFAAE